MTDKPDDTEEATISSPRAHYYTPFADRYLRSRAAFRENAIREFKTQEPRLSLILDVAGDLISTLTFFLSGRDLRTVDDGLYIAKLIVSYCRTHFIAADLIQQCELIEASVLIAKQMELIARLYELENDRQIVLEGRTPNVESLKSQAKRLHGGYAEIAHSSKEEPLALLGRIEMSDGVMTPLYPEFDSNAYVAAHNLGLLAAEFYVPCRAFCEKVAPNEALDTGSLHRFLVKLLADSLRTQESS